MTWRRPRAATIGIVLATLTTQALIVAGALAWQGNRQFRDEPLEQAPPATVTGTVATGVVRRLLAGTVHVGADPGTPVDVPPAVAAAAVVTRASAEAGDEIGLGRRIATIGERPIIVLRGDVPMFRAFALGVRGPDVDQAQRSLRALGYGIGTDEPGVIAEGTLSALHQLYRARGSTLLTASGARPGRATTLGQLTVPLGEIVFTPSGKATPLDDCGPVGRRIRDGQPVCRLATGAGAVTISLPDGSAAGARTGMPVTLEARPAERGLTLGPNIAPGPAGKPEEQSDATAAPAEPANGPEHRFHLRGLTSPPTSLDDTGATVTAASSPPRSLTVPSSALREGSGGHYLQRVDGATVPVRVGLCDAGTCAITPTTGNLEDGTAIVLYQGP